MKTYHANKRKTIAVAAVLLAVAVFGAFFGREVAELTRVCWCLLAGATEEPCTPDDRFHYLESHPGEIRVAMIGNWENLSRRGMPRRQVLETAIEDLNRAGGIAGRRFTAEWIDAAGSADAMVEAVEKVAHDPSYYAVFGPDTSGQMAVARPLLLTYRLLTFAPTVSDVHATRTADYPCIFLPNASDAQQVESVIDWAKSGGRDGFLLLGEDDTSSEEFARLAESMFDEQRISICGRTSFVPGKDVRFFEDERKSYDDYFRSRNVIVINRSTDEASVGGLVRKLLKEKSGDLFFYKLPEGDFSPEELARMFTLAHVEVDAKKMADAAHLAKIPGVRNDTFTPAAYTSVFLLADACRKAKSLRQEEVIEALRTERLETPFRNFRFTPERFEDHPGCHVISLAELRRMQSVVK